MTFFPIIKLSLFKSYYLNAVLFVVLKSLKFIFKLY